ncbi:hypothetical protein BH09ACT7_BH09ACT7_28680 [soil metagenome]
MTTTRTLTIGVAAVAALVALTACSNSNKDQANQTTAGTSTSATATAAHNQVDVMFTQRMIPHHQQAIQMSDMMLGKQGIDPRVVTLAKQIKAAQGPEIAQMQTWLSQWGLPTMPMMPGTEMPGMSGSPSESGSPHHSGTPSQSAMPSQTMMPSQSMMPGQGGMPSQSMMPGQGGMPSQSMMPGQGGMSGMMSEEDMTALNNAQGVQASKLFLTQMIQHHQGAITMAQNEISSGQYPATVALARSIVTSQQQEITTMQGILASM